MRILQINTSDHGGGAQSISYRLHESYIERGHDSKIVVGFKYGTDPNVIELPNLERRRKAARRLFPLESSLRKRGHLARLAPLVAFAGDPRRYAEVARGHEDFDYPGTAGLLDLTPELPDVVHAHNLHGGYFDLRALPQIAGRRPLLLTLHDQWLYTGHCAHPLGHERWRDGCGNCPTLGTYPAVYRDATAWNLDRKRDIYAHMKVRVATPSQWLMDRVRDSVLAPAITESRVIPNGVDLGVFSPGDKNAARTELGLPLDRPVVLFAANWTKSNPFKDYETLQAAIEILGTRGRNVMLACVGETAEDRDVGAATLRHFGHQGSPAALVPFYRAADAYLHAAKADTFPNTVLESLACGTPVVATAVGGIPEQVDEGETGLLAPGGDPAALAACVERLLDDEEARARMGRRAAEVARERYALDTMVDAYLDWFAEMPEPSRA
jgi:glycosyltransferase involved in cell wall biosynthesis